MKKLKQGASFNLYFPLDFDEMVLEVLNKQPFKNKYIVKVIQEHIKGLVIGQPKTDQVQIEALQKQVDTLKKVITENTEMLNSIQDKIQAPSNSNMDKTLEIIMQELTLIKRTQNSVKVKEEKTQERPISQDGKNEFIVDKNLDAKDIDWNSMF